MPEYVRKFSEGRIDEDDDVRLHNVLAHWLEKRAFAIYVSSSTGSTSSAPLNNKLAETELERFEKNMDAFIER